MVNREFTYQSSRCSNKLELQYIRREGSLYAVLLNINVDGRPIPAVRFEPNGLGALADWFRNNANMLDEAAQTDANYVGDPHG